MDDFEFWRRTLWMLNQIAHLFNEGWRWRKAALG
jgi:hypothetical protein